MNRANGGIVAFSALVGAAIIASAVEIQPFGLSHSGAFAAGLFAVLLSGLLAFWLRRARLQSLIGGLAGLISGSLIGLTFVFISSSVLASSPAAIFLRITVPALLAYIGLVTGLGKAGDFASKSAIPKESRHSKKVLDTSVLIDGRISDVVSSGFLEGPLIVPRFVLHELHVIADSPDSARRARGRRGLDVMQQLKDSPNLQVEVTSQDFTAVREVDLKLIELAKARDAKIVTNDFNLNKLAQVQGIEVLNINQLANSLKPVVLPGELMRVFILKEGKEHSQGIAYLDDGTMVVVDNARRMISKNIDIVVTSVLQTTAGKMIFGRYDERPQGESSRPLSASTSS